MSQVCRVTGVVDVVLTKPFGADTSAEPDVKVNDVVNTTGGYLCYEYAT
jgi:hypothetical protein